MKKLDHVKKTVYIIVGILTIISLVFSLYKKISHAASSDDSVLYVSGFPMFFGGSIADSNSKPDSFYLQILDDAITRKGDYVNGYPVFIYYNGNATSGFNYWVCFPLNYGNQNTNMPDSISSNTSFSIRCSKSFGYYSDGSFFNQSSGTSINITLNPYRVIEIIQGSYAYKGGSAINYPVFIYYPENLCFSNGVQMFSKFSSSSGGFSSDFIEQWEQLHGQDWENTVGDLNGNNVSDPSSLSEWLELISGNIISFFQRSIAGFKVLSDTIVNGFNSVYAWLSDLYDKIEDFFGRVFDTIFGWLSSIFDNTDSISDSTDSIDSNTSGLPDFISDTSEWFSDFWDNFDDHLDDFIENHLWGKLPDIMKAPFRIFNWFYTHGLNNGEFDFLTLFTYLFDFDSQSALTSFQNNKYGDFILDLRDFFSDLISSISGVTPSDRVFFTISLGDHFGVSIPDIEIDFSWYTQIRDNYIGWLMAFVYVTVLWLTFKRLPDIIKGLSGAYSSFEDNLDNPTSFSNVSFNHNTGIMTKTTGSRTRSGSISHVVSKKF